MKQVAKELLNEIRIINWGLVVLNTFKYVKFV